MAKPVVFVFARAPQYGTVKTRLARDIGAGEALRFYRSVLAGLVRRLARDSRFDIVIAVTPDLSAQSGALSNYGVRTIRQGSGDLGQRMLRALRSAGRCPAIVIGSDIPGITGSHVARAFVRMRSARVVLGPARDGGYWLIGAHHPLRIRERMLDGVRWSSTHALADTTVRLGDVAVLTDVLDDIDDGAAYRRLMHRLNDCL